MTKKNPKPAVSNAKSMGLKSKITFHAILWCFKFTFIGVVLASFVFLSLHQNLPSTEDITSTKLKTPLRVFSSEGLLIAEFGDERRKPIDIETAPQSLINAILASEDSSFYSHIGIDFKGILRAAINNYRSGSRQGASTITQQVARNYFLSSQQTYIRKIREIMLALKLESTLNKNQILDLYFNKIFLGHRSYGFAAAADVYYGKQLEELTIAEQAMLAGLPKAPSNSNPLSNPERAKSRRNYVLERLYENNWISKQQLEAELVAPISAKRQKNKSPVDAPYVAEMARLKILELYGEQAYWQGLDVYTNIQKDSQKAANQALRTHLLNYDKRHGFRGPLKSLALQKKSEWLNELQQIQPSGKIIPAVVVKVSKDTAKLMSRKQKILSITLESSQWAKKHISSNIVGSTPKDFQKLLSVGDIVYVEPTTEDPSVWQLSQLPQAQGALIATNAQNGKIIALAGGFDFYFNNYNRVTQAKRQPGSSIKPFIYAAAIDRGYSPETKISGAPIAIEDVAQGTVWRPQNYNKKFYPPTSLRVALARSMNIVSIRLLRAVGLDYGRSYLSKFGLDEERLVKSLSLALGSGNFTPLEINRAYTAIANNGYLVNPQLIDRIENRDGTILFKQKKQKLCDQCEKSTDEIAPRIMPKATSFIINNMLQDVVNFGTAKKAQALNRSDLGGKTGTTNDYVDAWFNGFGGGIVATTWIGFDTPQTLGHAESGGRTALPMWIDFMKIALQGKAEKKLPKPAGIFVNSSRPESFEVYGTQDQQEQRNTQPNRAVQLPASESLF